MRIEVSYDTPNVDYSFESSGKPEMVLRQIACQARMCRDHEKKIDKRIKAFEYQERNRAPA